MKLVKSQNVEVIVTFRGRKILKKEIKLTYQTENGAILTFMSDPKKAWSWNIYKDESNELGLKNANTIINAYIESISRVDCSSEVCA